MADTKTRKTICPTVVLLSEEMASDQPPKISRQQNRKTGVGRFTNLVRHFCRPKNLTSSSLRARQNNVRLRVAILNK